MCICDRIQLLSPALSFIKRLVVKGTQPDSMIAVKQFIMDAENTLSPSHFKFEFLIDDVINGFSVAVTHKAVPEKKLVMITSTSEGRIRYSRNET